MSEQADQSVEQSPWDDLMYNPAPSQPTGGPRRVYSQEAHDRVVFKVNTPYVGVDGLRRALRAVYGDKNSLPAGRTQEPKLIPELPGPTVDLLLPQQDTPSIETYPLGAPEEE